MMKQRPLPENMHCQVKEDDKRCPNRVAIPQEGYPIWWSFSDKKLAAIRCCPPHWERLFQDELKRELLKKRVMKE
jgi:hypothetical protein